MKACTNSYINPHTSKFALSKNRRNKSSIMAGPKNITEIPRSKRIKTEQELNHYDFQLDVMNNDSNTTKYDFLSENDLYINHENFNYNIDEIEIDDYSSSVPECDKYNIDDIDIESTGAVSLGHGFGAGGGPVQYVYSQQQQMMEEPSVMVAARSKSGVTKSKRKQGIVGRPTLSSTQELPWPDHVYSHGIYANGCHYDLESGEMTTTVPAVPSLRHQRTVPLSHAKSVRQHHHISGTKRTYRMAQPEMAATAEPDWSLASSAAAVRQRPRILTKPRLAETRARVLNHTAPQPEDSEEISKQNYLNQQFALNLINRAQRQGAKLDINKLPTSIFHPTATVASSQQHGDSAGSSPFSGSIAEIKRTDPETQPSHCSIADNPQRSPALHQQQLHSQIDLEDLGSTAGPEQTASTLLIRKWKSLNPDKEQH